MVILKERKREIMFWRRTLTMTSIQNPNKEVISPTMTFTGWMAKWPWWTIMKLGVVVAVEYEGEQNMAVW